MAKKPTKPAAIVNRRARYDYALDDEFVVGLSLTGPEVRAARDGHVQLKGSFAQIREGELWLNNASFSLKGANERTVDTTPRKLLAKRKELNRLSAARKDGFTIVPTKLLAHGRYIKLVIALGRGKKRYDKRQALKKRDEERDARRVL